MKIQVKLQNAGSSVVSYFFSEDLHKYISSPRSDCDGICYFCYMQLQYFNEYIWMLEKGQKKQPQNQKWFIQWTNFKVPVYLYCNI